MAVEAPGGPDAKKSPVKRAPPACLPDAPSITSHVRSVVAMSTIVTIHVVSSDHEPHAVSAREAAIERAFGWFHHVEQTCSRFLEDSEARQLTKRVGIPTPVSPLLFEAVRFAIAVAEETGGAFDPTVGARMVERGFAREHRSGRIVRIGEADAAASFRDVRLDLGANTITLLRPLVLDLGAVAKGLAVDMAVRELQPFANFAVDAGGDLYVAGRNPGHEPWAVGIRHPRRDDELIETLHVSDTTVCTSGDYERRPTDGQGGHHILDPRTGASPDAVASVTVLAPTAMLADALATAAFVLGPEQGLQLLERHGVRGLIVSAALECLYTQGFVT